MKKRNKALLTVGTLASVLGGINILEDIDISAASIMELVSPQVWTDRPEQLFDVKEIDKTTSTQFYTQKGEFGCGATHHIAGGCGANHLPKEKYEALPSEHNPGNRLDEKWK